MAVVDLSELIADLEVALTSPGVDGYPTVSEEEWVDRLRGGFWEAALDGVISGYEETDGIVTPYDSSAPGLSREMQQLVILYAAMTVTRNELMSLRTVFRTKSGSNEYEVQQSATVLKALLDNFAMRLTRILERVEQSSEGGTFYIDGVTSRLDAINGGASGWIR